MPTLERNENATARHNLQRSKGPVRPRREKENNSGSRSVRRGSDFRSRARPGFRRPRVLPHSWPSGGPRRFIQAPASILMPGRGRSRRERNKTAAPRSDAGAAIRRRRRRRRLIWPRRPLRKEVALTASVTLFVTRKQSKRTKFERFYLRLPLLSGARRFARDTFPRKNGFRPERRNWRKTCGQTRAPYEMPGMPGRHKNDWGETWNAKQERAERRFRRTPGPQRGSPARSGSTTTTTERE